MSKERPPYLTSGAGSGLGRFLWERLGGAALTRRTTGAEREELLRRGADVILHCAARAPRAGGDPLGSHEEDVRLTEALARAPHRVFVFLSTVDVYPAGGGLRREDGPLAAGGELGPYAASKLAGEALVRRACPGHLILRPTSLLGPTMRPNSATRILKGDCSLGLSGDSVFNYVLHEDVLAFLRIALERGLSGTYNAASTGNVTLAQVAELWGRRVAFGTHRYDVGLVDNAKIRAVAPAFRRGSAEALREFARSCPVP